MISQGRQYENDDVHPADGQSFSRLLQQQVCAAYGVVPWELGIEPRLTDCCQKTLTRGHYGRCTGCGHRQSRHGRQPLQTRWLPWLWPLEHLLRWRACRRSI